MVNAIIGEHFKDSVACQVHEVIDVLAGQSEGLFEYGLLPSLADHQRLSQLFTQLSDLGEFVYLPSDNIGDGWIIFDRHLLFTEVNGPIFAYSGNNRLF